MSSHFRHSLTALFASTILAGPALADITAQDVWSDWRDYMTSTGYEVTASEAMSGNTLTVSGLKLQMALPDGQGTIAMDANEIAFTENGDGTVSIAVPATMPLSISGSGPEGDFDVRVDMTQTGHSISASGSPEEVTYAYNAAQVDLTLGQIMVDGADMSQVAQVTVQMSNLASTTTTRAGDVRHYDQKMSSDGLTYNFAFDDPESEDGAILTGRLDGLGMESTSALPASMATGDMAAMIAAGFAFDVMFSYSGGQTQMSGQDGSDKFEYASSSQGGQLGMAMDKGKLAYSASQSGTDLTVAGSEIPFPIAMQMAESGFNLLMPLAKSDTEQDFELGILLGDFQVADMLWGIFDPAGALPHDPATIALDLSGKVKVLADLLDPATAAQIEAAGMPPVELGALKIGKLLVSAVGASLSGTGDVTFDNTDLQTFNGFPRPIGAVDLKLDGANGLIDRLIQMGLVSDQDAMGARMMMGMLAVPGEGEDSLTSRIEMNEEGHVLANGQRIQ